MRVQIIDYGMGNLRSVKRAFESCGADVVIVDSPRLLDEKCKIVLPGVGAFGDGMMNLYERGFDKALIEIASSHKTPILGICLGMQMLATKGFEFGEHMGLNLVPGKVLEMIGNESCKIPHVGWNDVNYTNSHSIFENIPTGCDFYFVHSFHFDVDNAEHALAITSHAAKFVSVVKNDNVYGVQFHPEKSQRVGLQLIKNFIALK